MTIQPYEAARHVPALLNPTTDSWTAILEDVAELAQKICATEFVPPSLRGNIAKTAAAVLYGRELGLPPMTALAGVHVVQGRAGISAELMRALILQAGHEIAITESTGSRCVMKGRRSDWEEWTTASYSMEEANRSGDSKKNANYQTRPAEMLLARASTRLARMIFADVIHGMRSVEELQDMGEGDEVYIAPVVEQVKVSRQASKLAVESAPAPSKMGEAAAGVEAGEAASIPPAASPAARKSAPLKPRGRLAEAKQAVAEALAQGDDEPEPDGAEYDQGVEQAAASGAAMGSAPEAEASGKANDELHRKAITIAVMHFDRLGVSERAERLWATQVLVGRPVKSTNELSLTEVRDLAKRLERMRDRDALERVLKESDNSDE